MPSVTQAVRQAKQPRGGFINPRTMQKTDCDDGSVLNPHENISPAMMGLIVDYMSRYMLTEDPSEAFRISLDGALAVDGFVPGAHYDRACNLLFALNGLTPASIAAAYQLASYDCAFRAGPATYVDSSDHSPDEPTCQNAIAMVERTLRFVARFGPIAEEGMTFVGGYTERVSSGDADFCTKDTLWDMKVSKYAPTKENTLQLMLYYLMAQRARLPWVATVDSIGIWNPRLNAAWVKKIGDIDDVTIVAIEQDVLGV